jgi:UDP-glucose 4-epimerase
MNVLVFGGLGFIGSNLCNSLKSYGYNPIIIDNQSTGSVNNLSKDYQFEVHFIDVSKNESTSLIKDLIFKYNINLVYHLAALPNVQQSIQETYKTHQSTLTTTLNILESIKEFKRIKIVFSSTSAVYGDCDVIPTNEDCKLNPLTPYALQKLMSEQYIKMYCDIHKISAVIFRYFNVYGDNMTNVGAYRSVLSIFKEQFKLKHALTITNDGSQRRDFIHVDDVVSANILAGFKDIDSNFEVFNVGCGENFSVNEIANKFNSQKTFIGHRIETKISLCDNSKIKKYFNWTPSKNVLKWIEEYVEDK